MERCVDALESQVRDAQIDAAKERSLSEVHLRRKRALEAENQQLKGQWPPDYNGLRTRAENAEAAWKKEVALAMDLAARVRELEADDKNAHGVKCVALLARAEKAEHERDLTLRHYNRAVEMYNTRVPELEAVVRLFTLNVQSSVDLEPLQRGEVFIRSTLEYLDRADRALRGKPK